MADSELRALTLCQPWATLVVIGAKPWETRTWATRYRGPLIIHASGSRYGLVKCQNQPAIHTALAAVGLDLATLPLGAVVGTAEVIECWPTEDLSEDVRDAFGDYGPGRYAWYVARARALATPVVCHGRQRLWKVPASCAARIQSAL